MDNDNYNNQNGYNDFNGGYGNRRPAQRAGLATASLIVGILSVPLGYCTGYLGIIMGITAVVLGIFSKGNAHRMSGKSIGGIITGAIGTVLGFSMLAMALWMIKNNPDIMKQYQDLIDFYNR